MFRKIVASKEKISMSIGKVLTTYAQDPKTGNHHDHVLHSKAMGRDIISGVFTPGDIGKEEKLPVIYLLHGVLGHWYDWKDHYKDLLQFAQEHRVIIITPDGEAEQCYVDNKENSPQSYIMKELLPYIDASLPTNGKRGIAGYSMGGFGAFNMVLDFPDKFDTFFTVSAPMDLYNGATKNGPNILRYIGEKDTAGPLLKSLSPIYTVADRVDILKNKPMGMLIGATDHMVLENQQMHKQLLDLGIEHPFLIYVNTIKKAVLMKAVPKITYEFQQQIFENPGEDVLVFKPEAGDIIRNNPALRALLPFFKDKTDHNVDVFWHGIDIALGFLISHIKKNDNENRSQNIQGNSGMQDVRTTSKGYSLVYEHKSNTPPQADGV